MKNLIINPPLLGFILGTRAALALGVGLMLADRLGHARRQSLARSLIALGMATTVPAARMVFTRHRPVSRRDRFLSWARSAMRARR